MEPSLRAKAFRPCVDMHPSLISLLSPLILIFALILSTNAIYAHQAGVIDWHKQYLGVPLTHTQQVAPRFHKIGGAGGKGQAVWLAATERNILGAVNPSEGNIGAFYGTLYHVHSMLMCLLLRPCCHLASILTYTWLS